MKFNRSIPEEVIEPEIARKLVVDRIDLPVGEDYEGSISEEQLNKFDYRFHPFVLADSRTVHALEDLWYRMALFNRQVRRHNADQVRIENRRRKGVTHWIEIVIAAAVGALFSYLVSKLK